VPALVLLLRLRLRATGLLLLLAVRWRCGVLWRLGAQGEAMGTCSAKVMAPPSPSPTTTTTATASTTTTTTARPAPHARVDGDRVDPGRQWADAKPIPKRIHVL
jgi:hypothetical protein